jgi:hypothetical protein
MARATWSGFMYTSARLVSVSSLISPILAGLKARWISSVSLLVKLITSMFSLRSSRTMPWMRDPFMPTQAPTGSMRSS